MFLFLAISRQIFTNEAGLPFVQRLRQDREVRLTVLIVSLLPLALFLRHWVGALDDLALYGAVFPDDHRLCKP